MTEQRELEILRPYVAECGKLVDQNFKLEQHLKKIDRLLLEVLMGDIDPMQAMINRQKIKDEYEQA
ncbi:MAG: hypothetical protein WCK82_14980 [Bacteroidota bacterium]